jgi:hypothetical protein
VGLPFACRSGLDRATHCAKSRAPRARRGLQDYSCASPRGRSSAHVPVHPRAWNQAFRQAQSGTPQPLRGMTAARARSTTGQARGCDAGCRGIGSGPSSMFRRAYVIGEIPHVRRVSLELFPQALELTCVVGSGFHWCSGLGRIRRAKRLAARAGLPRPTGTATPRRGDALHLSHHGNAPPKVGHHHAAPLPKG